MYVGVHTGFPGIVTYIMVLDSLYHWCGEPQIDLKLPFERTKITTLS